MIAAAANALGFCPTCGADTLDGEPCSDTCMEDSFVFADAELVRTRRMLGNDPPKRERAWLERAARAREEFLRAEFKAAQTEAAE